MSSLKKPLNKFLILFIYFGLQDEVLCLRLTLNSTITNSTNSTQSKLIDSSDTSFVIICSILVMLMTPALGFFYGGLVKTHNMMSMLGQCLTIYCVSALIWTIVGFSLVFCNSSNWGLIGGLSHALLIGVDYKPNTNISSDIPFFLIYFFEMQFACVCPALIIGATAERIRWKPMIIFCLAWHLLVYCPIAHWNWNHNGWLNLLGIKDFAGGNVIHITAGMSAMAVVIYLENEPIRKTSPRSIRKQELTTQYTDNLSVFEKDELIVNINFSKSSLVFMVIGTMLLWFGWFGFNAGSAFKSDHRALLAAVNTNISPAFALITWVLLDFIYKKKPSVSGMCMSVVCGLAGITPGAGFLRVWATIVIGIFSTLCAYFTLLYRDKYKIMDDRLDVFGCHAVSGIVGGLGVGFFFCDITIDGSACSTSEGYGIVYGDYMQLCYQLIGIVSTVAYSFITTYLIITILSVFMDVSTGWNIEEGFDKLDFNEYGLPPAELRIPNDESSIRA
jgi:Amt family ammonium transporter